MRGPSPAAVVPTTPPACRPTDSIGSVRGETTDSRPLARNRSFKGFLGAQFLGAFNDNLYKQIILLLAAGTLFPGQDMQGVAFAVFAVPFVLLGGVAGEVSERFSKSRIMVGMKAAEIVIMALGMGALALRSWEAMLAVLFLMGVHSTFFGPCKYGGMPEMVGESRLLSANGVVAMTTFLAILLGAALPGPAMDLFAIDTPTDNIAASAAIAGGNVPGGGLRTIWLVGLPCVVLAVVGLLFARRIAYLPPQKPDLRLRANPFGGLGGTLRVLRERPALLAVVVGMSLFWFNGGVLNQAVNGLAASAWLDLGVGEKSWVSWLLMAQSVALVVGSLAAAPLARRFPPVRVVLGGATGMVMAQVALLAVGPVLGATTGGYAFTVVCLAATGVFGALFFVPVNAWLQAAIEAGGRGRAFAANNFVNFLFIFLSGLWYFVLRGALDLPPAFSTAAAGLVMLAYLFHHRAHIRTIEFAQ